MIFSLSLQNFVVDFLPEENTNF